MQGQDSKVLETVRSPEMVLQGDYGEKLAVRFYADNAFDLQVLSGSV